MALMTEKELASRLVKLEYLMPMKNETNFYQLLGRVERPRDYVVYDGTKCHYVPCGSFFFGSVVSQWLVPGTI